jgi:beta-ureidopropionase
MRASLCLSCLLIGFAPNWTAAAASAFRVAALKVMPVYGDQAANFATFERLARQAAAQGARLIVTPETYLDGYMGNPKSGSGMTREKMPGIAEPIDGPWLKKAGALARELKVYILFGFSELRDGKVFNTIAILAPDGSLAGRYSKSHLAGGEWYEPGNELPVFDTQLGRFGILICFDRKPPETARTLTLKGAQFIVVPAYNKTSTPLDEDILMRARSQENAVYVIYTSPYNAFVADPVGEIISQVRNETDGLMFADIVLDGRIHDHGALRSRRPEMYEPLTVARPGKPKSP